MTTTTDRVALILDALGHEDTELTGQSRLWRHRDGRYFTEDEAEIVGKCTVGEIRQAMDLWHEEVLQLQEHTELVSEYLDLVAGCGPHEPLVDYASRLPEPQRSRAAQIWQQVEPELEAWLRERS